MKNAYGPSIILFTILIRILIFPLSYQQIASTQMTQALNPKVQEIKEKYADNKDLQNQMTALLYQETKVPDSTFYTFAASDSHLHVFYYWSSAVIDEMSDDASALTC